MTQPHACSAGTALTRQDGYAGLDWQTPCPHPVVYAVYLTDLDADLLLCHCHGHALSAQLSEPGPEEEIRHESR